jgi:hypothetical protein
MFNNSVGNMNKYIFHTNGGGAGNFFNISNYNNTVTVNATSNFIDLNVKNVTQETVLECG